MASITVSNRSEYWALNFMLNDIEELAGIFKFSEVSDELAEAYTLSELFISLSSAFSIGSSKGRLFFT